MNTVCDCGHGNVSQMEPGWCSACGATLWTDAERAEAERTRQGIATAQQPFRRPRRDPDAMPVIEGE